MDEQSAASPSATNNVPLLSAPDLFEKAWGIYRKKFWRLIAIQAVTYSVFAAAILAGLGLIFGYVYLGGAAIIAGAMVLFAGIIFALVIGAWAQLAMAYTLRNDANLKESFRQTKHLIGAFITTSVAAFLVVAGFLWLFIVPAIIAGLWFSFWLFMVAEDNLSGMDALIKSREYARGKWGAIFWRFFFLALVVLGVYALLGILSGAMVAFGGISTLIWNAITPLVSFLWAPLTFSYSFLLYDEFKSARHDVVPTKKEKRKFVLWAIGGWVFLIAIIVFVIVR